MHKVNSIDEILKNIGEIRTLKFDTISNFIFNHDELSEWIGSGNCYNSRVRNSIFLSHYLNDTYQILYISTDIYSLKEDLTIFTSNSKNYEFYNSEVTLSEALSNKDKLSKTKIENLKIVFLGEDSFSCIVLNSLINANYDIRLVLTPKYNNLKHKRLESICKKYDIKFLREENINAPHVVSSINETNPDIGIISHFEKLICPDLIKSPKLGFINLHPSLLPKYRGMAPQHWPIINGEKETGITIHHVQLDADTGDIIIQKRFPLPSSYYVSDLQKLWQSYYTTIMIEAISCLLTGKPTFKQQGIASYYGKLKTSDRIISPEFTVEEAYNLIRGVSFPYEGAIWGETRIYSAVISEYKQMDAENIGLDLSDETNPILKLKDGVISIKKYK